MMENWEKQYRLLLEEMAANPPLRALGKDDLPETGVWYKLQMPECTCAGGSDYCIYLKKGAGQGLILHMVGGGLSWNEETARFPGSLRNQFSGEAAFYTDEVQPNNDYYFFRLPKNNGIFSLGSSNRFADWSIVMVNYGTADLHIGQSDFPYAAADGTGRILRHHGYANFQACLRTVKKMFPAPEMLLLTGESAGAFAVPAIAEDVIAAYPECQNITVYSDSALLRTADWPRIVREVWRAPERIAQAIQTDNLVLDLYRQLAARVGARIKYLYSCGAGDMVLTMYQILMNTGRLEISAEACARFCEDLSALVDAFHALGVPFGVYIHDFTQNGGIRHVILNAETFNEASVDGVTPMDWLWNAVEGKIADIGLQLLPAHEAQKRG